MGEEPGKRETTQLSYGVYSAAPNMYTYTYMYIYMNSIYMYVYNACMWDIQQGPWPLRHLGSSLVRRDEIQRPVLFHGPRLYICAIYPGNNQGWGRGLQLAVMLDLI